MSDHGHADGEACAQAHQPVVTPAGAVAGSRAAVGGALEPGERTLVAVFVSPVAGILLRFGAELGYRPVLVEPDPVRRDAAAALGLAAAAGMPPDLGDQADVVMTDHHRDELGPLLRDALDTKARWIGLMGNPRHIGPHVEALAALGVSPAEVARVHRPIGLNIGSRTPPEIAIATLAGLVADRNGRPGGFTFLPAASQHVDTETEVTQR